MQTPRCGSPWRAAPLLVALAMLLASACAPAAAPPPTAAPAPPSTAAAPAPTAAAPTAVPKPPSPAAAASPVAVASPLAAPSPAAAPAASPAAKPAAAASPSPSPLPTIDKSPVAAGEIGSSQRPFVLLNVPFMDAARLTRGMESIARRLQEETGLVFSTAVPTSYAAVVEALCADRADASFISPLPYVLARQKCGADMLLVSVTRGAVSYRGQINTRADSGIRTLADLKGKRFAWTDASSTSGYLYPRATIVEAGINPDRDFAQAVFAGGHDKALIALLNNQVDAAATYEGAETIPGVQQTFPDVAQRLRIIGYTPDIPNDGVAFRKGLPPAIQQRVRDGLLRIAAGPEGDRLLNEAMGINGLAPTTDAAYEPVRRAATVLNLNLEESIQKPG